MLLMTNIINDNNFNNFAFNYNDNINIA